MEEKMWATIRVGIIIQEDWPDEFVINIYQEPWGLHKNEIVRVFRTNDRFHIVQVAERLSELLQLNVTYSDKLTVEEFLERAR